jgi:hypothetical protein
MPLLAAVMVVVLRRHSQKDVVVPQQIHQRMTRKSIVAREK